VDDRGPFSKQYKHWNGLILCRSPSWFRKFGKCILNDFIATIIYFTRLGKWFFELKWFDVLYRFCYKWTTYITYIYAYPVSWWRVVIWYEVTQMISANTLHTDVSCVFERLLSTNSHTRCFRNIERRWWHFPNAVVCTYTDRWSTMVQSYISVIKQFLWRHTYYGLKFWDGWNDCLIIWYLAVIQLLITFPTRPDKDGKKNYLNREISKYNRLTFYIS